MEEILLKIDSKKCSFIRTVREYHFYKLYWHSEEKQLLHLLHEKEHPFNIFAIKATKICYWSSPD